MSDQISIRITNLSKYLYILLTYLKFIIFNRTSKEIFFITHTFDIKYIIFLLYKLSHKTSNVAKNNMIGMDTI